MQTSNFDKIYKRFQVIVFLVVIIIATAYYIIPDLKDNFGSSDSFVNTKEITSIIGIKLPSGPDFSLIINNNTKITNILFHNTASLCLYNKEIENQNLSSSLNRIITILEDNSYLTENSTIILIEYEENKDYLVFKKSFQEKTKDLNINYQESQSTVIDKVNKLALISSETGIKALEEYSKSLISNYKDQKLITSLKEKEELTEENASLYADNVYLRLTNYALNVSNQGITDSTMPIQLIPAITEKNIYPTENSWYYIKEHKVYAYIEFKSTTQSYAFCYNGSKDSKREGNCE